MTFKDYIGGGSTGIIGILNTAIVPVIFAFAFAAFIWGIVNYFFLSANNEGNREEGKQFIFWGIIGMVVMFSVWGFVSLLLSTLGIAP